MSKLDLGGTVKRTKPVRKNTNSTQRSHKAVASSAQLRTKALTVKFTPDEYKALRVYAMDKDMSHQDVIHAAVLKKILKK
jgi:hypothetical protein